MTYDPENYLLSTERTIKDYATTMLNTDIYDVVMEFAGSVVDAQKQPIKKTVIHFALDDDDEKPVGFGDNMFADNYDATNQEILPQYASVHRLTYDVGVWASDRSGGTTQRARARQAVNRLFGVGGGGSKEFQAFSDGGDGGIEVLSLSGGRFVLDTAQNDFRLYRMVDCQLVVRVFSRTPVPAVAVPTIETITQDNSGITIIG